MTHPINDDTAEEQLTLSMDGETAKLAYELDGDVLRLVHTEVPEAFRGQGVGGLLVEAALAKARAATLTIVPWCPYARRWLEDHRGRIGDLTVDFETPPPWD
jgi:uncharacterized protein